MHKSPHQDQNERYKFKNYWDDRYLAEKSFEWCKSYFHFRHLITRYVEKESRILILGCGNSQLSEELYEDGYENITNIDFSSVVLHNVKFENKTPRMEWLTMDIRRLLFRRGSFDVVLEKATLDSLLVDEKDPWNISAEGRQTLTSILMQVSHLLVSGGRFLSLTFAQPHFRKKLLCQARFKWSVEHFTYGDGFNFFFYVMVKNELPLHHEWEEEEGEEEEGEVKAVVKCASDSEGEDFIYRIMGEDD